MNREARIAVTALALIAAIMAVAWQRVFPMLALLGEQDRLQTWLVSFGAGAPLVAIMLNAAQVIAAPIPGQVIGLANGYLFGVWLGTFYSLIGVMLGTGIVLALTRRWGRPLAARLVPPPHLEKLDRLVALRGELFFFLIFLLPFLPDDLTCFAIGLTDLPLARMLALIAIGRLPGLIAASWFGAYAADITLTGWTILIIGASGLGLAYWRWRDVIEARLMNWIECVTRKR